MRSLPPVPAVLLTAVLAALAGCGGDPAAPDGLSPEARAYVNEALDVMQRASVNRYRIDWPRFRAAALARAGAARTPAETHPSLAVTVRELGDRHSRFFPPGAGAGPADPPPSATNRPAGRMLDERLAYLFVPGFAGTNPSGRADSTQAIVRRLDGEAPAPPCGWVVDLRLNGGGNMFPMVAGVGPLLGEGVAGQFVDPDGVRTDWFYVAGRAGTATATSGSRPVVGVTDPYRLRREAPPIAVLQGPRTASSGEATAISFRLLPNARSFGGPTAGLSTANAPFRLSDGAILNLTSAVMADRAGVLYGDAVPPDEPVAGPEAPVPGEPDVVVRAAMEWLAAQPACAAS